MKRNNTKKKRVKTRRICSERTNYQEYLLAQSRNETLTKNVNNWNETHVHTCTYTNNLINLHTNQ